MSQNATSGRTSVVSGLSLSPRKHAPARAKASRATSEVQSKSRVVHISLGMNIGGMEKLLVQFARLADRQQFELAFISLQSRGKLAPEIEDLNWPVYALDKPTGLRPGVLLKLVRRLRKLRPDVVHTHNTAAFLYGTTAAKLAGVPRVIHTRHGQRFGASARETAIFRFLSRFAHRVISVSEDGCRLTIAEGVADARAGWIHNGVDLDQFPYSGPDPDGPAVIVARLSAEKDVATLVRAMHHIEQQRIEASDRGLRLRIIGDGAMRQQLQSLAESLEVESAIEFLGERDDVPRLLARASMFVLPSLTEGISLTLLEAMAGGLPVVATAVGGNPEVVVDGRTGWLVPSQDPPAMAEAMLRIQRNRQRAIEMGRLGRERVEAQFSVQRMVEQYERQYLDGGAA